MSLGFKHSGPLLDQLEAVCHDLHQEQKGRGSTDAPTSPTDAHVGIQARLRARRGRDWDWVNAAYDGGLKVPPELEEGHDVDAGTCAA